MPADTKIGFYFATVTHEAKLNLIRRQLIVSGDEDVAEWANEGLDLF
jgi:hypothetical protein